MSKFELSDKELKQLLQSEGLEEPSLSFNRHVLEQVRAYEQAKAIKTPLVLKIVFAMLMIVPLTLIFINGGSDFGLGQLVEGQQLNLSAPKLNFQFNNYYIYFLALTVGVAWLSLFFYKLLGKMGNHSVKNG